jgi:integrase
MEELRVSARKKRKSTFRTDCVRLKALTAFLGDDDVASVTPRRLMEYRQERLRQNRMAHTVNGELRTCSLVLHWAQREGRITDVPKTEPVPVTRRRQVIPTPEEIARLLEALPERLRPMVRFMAETGCRKSEALQLTRDSVDEVNGFVEIRPREGWTPKTAQSERSIPLSAPLLETLRRLPKQSMYVFPGKKTGKPITNFRSALASAIEKADIRRNGRLVHLAAPPAQGVRHTWQAMRGVNESVLQDLLGHARGSRVTREHYVHATEEAKRAAVLALPLVGNG